MDTEELYEILIERIDYLHNTFDTIDKERYQKQIRIVFFDTIKFDHPSLYEYKGVLVRQIGILYDTNDTVTRTDVEDIFARVLNPE